MDTASRHYEYRFDALLHAHPEERDSLAQLLIEQGVSPIFELHALRRRRQWATTLPLGAFGGDFRIGIASFDTELETRDSALKEAVPLYQHYVYPPRRHFHWAGNEYYPAVIIAGIRHVVTPRWFLTSMHNFLEAAEKNPSLIRGSGHRNHAPPQQRAPGTRGALWSAEEDMVLRQWFGPRTYGDHAGKHVKLTEEEWAKVLARLGGLRTPCAIRARIRDLNFALKRELSIDGYIPANRFPEYCTRVLGENPRPPRSTPVRTRRRA